MIVNEMSSSSSSSRPICLTSLTATEALTRPDISASEWLDAQRNLILNIFGDTAAAEAHLAMLSKDFDEACLALARKEAE